MKLMDVLLDTRFCPVSLTITKFVVHFMKRNCLSLAECPSFNKDMDYCLMMYGALKSKLERLWNSVCGWCLAVDYLSIECHSPLPSLPSFPVIMYKSLQGQDPEVPQRPQSLFSQLGLCKSLSCTTKIHKSMLLNNVQIIQFFWWIKVNRG